jgi:hypothetical protein
VAAGGTRRRSPGRRRRRATAARRPSCRSVFVFLGGLVEVLWMLGGG